MIKASTIQLEQSWLEQLENEFNADYMQTLFAFLEDEKQNKATIYPAEDKIFAALNSAPLNKVKVVILGQDPYHGPEQAHGLSFSVPKDQRIPPSLLNMYKEIHNDLGIAIPEHGNLESWAQQGVLLLNSVLTVRQAEAASHQGKGWEEFTDKIISIINEESSNIVFMLWGNYAQKKGKMIDREKHCVLTAAHPSPLSAYRGFLGCGHFSKTNDYLQSVGETPIDWAIKS